METTSFSVPSITCSVCSNKINDALKNFNGVGNVNVDLKTKQVMVDYNPSEVQPGDLRKAVSELGFEVIQ